MHVFPVCSPEVARRLQTPADILRHRVLIDETIYDEWPRWFAAVDVEFQPSEVRSYSDDIMLLRAAMEGQGVTLARSLTAHDELDAGRLVRPFDNSVLSMFQYHFVCPPERLTEPAIQAFHAWLEREIK
jgi:LysR family glycine cleavage system transcriptional activator